MLIGDEGTGESEISKYFTEYWDKINERKNIQYIIKQIILSFCSLI